MSLLELDEATKEDFLARREHRWTEVGTDGNERTRDDTSVVAYRRQHSRQSRRKRVSDRRLEVKMKLDRERTKQETGNTAARY